MRQNTHLLIQVVAQLKPERCGVSDYALSLAKEAKASFGIRTAFVVVNSNERCESLYQTIYCTQSELLAACDSLTGGETGTILAHVSGYGFSKDGAPTELAEALSSVKESGRFHMGAYFHELYVTGSPWKAHFWYQRRQKAAIRRIGGSVNVLATNLSLHAEWLMREAAQGSKTPVVRLPVFSNIGESSVAPAVSCRASVLTVFGLPGTRKRAYAQLSSMGATLRTLEIEQILDIGPECDVPSHVRGISIRRLGALSSPEIQSFLLNSRFGFVPHPRHAFAKSGVFAAISALGAIPVINKPFSQPSDGLSDGVHLISPMTARDVVRQGLQACSSAVWNWYSEHRLYIHAATFARLLFPTSIEGNVNSPTNA